MRHLALAMAILATGCYRWAPVTSLSSIEDAKVKIQQGAETMTLEHATATGREIEGQPVDGAALAEPSEDCKPPSCARADVSNAHVMMRKVNVPVVAVIATGVAVIVGVAVGFAIAIASIRQAIPDMPPPP